MNDDKPLMQSFADELDAAFSEVEQKAMPVNYTLTNLNLNGVIRKLLGETPSTEAGFEPRNMILIVSTRSQFPQEPIANQDGSREIVQVLSGAYRGKWVLSGVDSDLVHYYLSCTFSQ